MKWSLETFLGFLGAPGTAKVSLPSEGLLQSAQETVVSLSGLAPKWIPQDLTATEPGTPPSPAPCPPWLSPAAPSHCRLWGPHCIPAGGNRGASTSRQDHAKLYPRHSGGHERKGRHTLCSLKITNLIFLEYLLLGALYKLSPLLPQKSC